MSTETETPTASPLRVLFADNSRPLIEAWRRVLENQADMEMVGAVERADDLGEHVLRLRPDLVVLDLCMDGRDSIHAMRDAMLQAPHVRWVVYTGHDDMAICRKVRLAGAAAFLKKTTETSEVLDALRRVAKGEGVFPGWRNSGQQQSA